MKFWRERRNLTWLGPVLVLALGAGACSDDGAATITTDAVATTEATTTTSEPIETTSSPPTETTASEAETADTSSLIGSDELCELLPAAEIGAVMNADAQVTTFGGGPGTLCDVGIAWTGTSLHVIVELLNNGGDAGFEEGVAFEARVFNVDPIDIAGVGNRAASFGDRIIVQSDQSVVRIGGFPEELVVPELEEIGNLVAAAFS